MRFSVHILLLNKHSLTCILLRVKRKQHIASKACERDASHHCLDLPVFRSDHLHSHLLPNHALAHDVDMKSKWRHAVSSDVAELRGGDVVFGDDDSEFGLDRAEGGEEAVDACNGRNLVVIGAVLWKKMWKLTAFRTREDAAFSVVVFAWSESHLVEYNVWVSDEFNSWCWRTERCEERRFWNKKK